MKKNKKKTRDEVLIDTIKDKVDRKYRTLPASYPDNGGNSVKSITKRRHDGSKPVKLVANVKHCKLTENYGDGKYLYEGTNLLPNGNLGCRSKGYAKWMQKSRDSPYRQTVATPQFIEKKKAEELKISRLRSPIKEAQKSINLVIQDMMKIGNEPSNFRVADLVNTENNNNSSSKSADDIANARTRPQQERKRPRILSPALRPKFVKTFDEPMFDLIDEWKTETEAILNSPASPDIQKNMKLPSLDDVVKDYGNGPKFYNINRHPFPGRLPSRFEDTDSFLKQPEVEWRDSPEGAVLKRAYQYMLGNVPVKDESSLEISISKEMKKNLDNVFKKNVGTGFWKDEVSSTVAQPLSAEAFCNSRHVKLFSSQSAPGLDLGVDLPVETAPESREQSFRRLDSRECASRETQTPSTIEKDRGIRPKSPTPEQRMWEFCFSDEAHDASTVIQRCYKLRLLARHSAATSIQKLARGRLGRNYVRTKRKMYVLSASVIQGLVRGRLGRRCLTYIRMARSYGMPLQELKHWHLVDIPANVRIERLKQKAEEARRRHDQRVGSALAQLQAIHRGHLGRKYAAHVREERDWKTKVAVHIQRIYRGNRLRAEMQPQHSQLKLGLARMQARWRGGRDRRRFKRLMTKRHQAALQVQRVYRGHRARSHCERKHLENVSATKINSAARSKLSRRVLFRWKISRTKQEKKRLQLEGTVVEAAVKKSLEETKAYLKTREGREEFKVSIREAKEHRQALKARRAKMCEEELDESLAVEAFELFDMDGSDEIDETEFRKAVSELCIPLTSKQITVALHDMDEDGNGIVTKSEFVAWHRSKGKQIGATSALSKTLNGAIQLKLKSSKTVRDMSGSTDRAMAKRKIFAERSQIARRKAIKLFRQKHPCDYWYHTYILPFATKRKKNCRRTTFA